MFRLRRYGFRFQNRLLLFFPGHHFPGHGQMQWYLIVKWPHISISLRRLSVVVKISSASYGVLHLGINQKRLIVEYSEKIKEVMRLHYSCLQEKDRRHYAAVEAIKLGYGGVTYISKVLSVDRNTIIEGKKELLVMASQQDLFSVKKQRRAGGGRKKKELTA